MHFVVYSEILKQNGSQKKIFSKGLPWRQAAKKEGQDQGTAGQVTQPGS